VSLILPGGGAKAAAPLGSGFLLGSDQQPTPPSHLQARLTDIFGDRLHVSWHPVMHRWAVAEKWHPTDKRWKLHREGQISWPYDVVVFLPADQDPETVGDYIVEQLHRCDLSKQVGRRKVIQRVRELQYHNQRVAEQARRAAVEPILDEVKHNARYILSKNGMGKIAKAENIKVVYRR
jgi:hypothetical protein